MKSTAEWELADGASGGKLYQKLFLAYVQLATK